MSKEIKIKDDMASDYIVVGDTLNGKTITEIWCTSTGTAMFCLDNNHDRYLNYKELIDEICEADPSYDDSLCEYPSDYAELYKSVTSGR